MKMKIDSKPEELELLDRHIIQLRIEISALMDEKDKFSIARLKDLKIELADFEIKSGNLVH
jgi:ATP-dependent Clp protease ATP-binding subunit ClpB